MSERFVLEREGGEVAGEYWPGESGLIVLLHEGVSDRRGWRPVAERLAPRIAVVAYDRRGFGESPVSTVPFTHLDDLLAVLDQYSPAGPAWLAGASAGGGLALDAALAAPGRLAGVVVIGTAISGAPEPELDPVSLPFDALWEAAAGNLDELNRIETWLWLDGPGEPEGRVGGAVRELALDMNAIILRNGDVEHAGESGIQAWDRLGEIRLPVTVACGELDAPFLRDRNVELARRLPQATYQDLPGVAHQPYLEQPDLVADLVGGAISSGNARSPVR